MRLSRLGIFALVALGLAGTAEAQSITFLHTPPATARAGEPLHIVGNIFGAGEVARARVLYRRPGGRYSQVELEPTGGDEFEANIPGRAVQPPAVEYHVVAIDLLGRRQEIFASEQSPQSVPVTGQARAPEPPPRVSKPDAGVPEAEPAVSQPDAGPPKSQLEDELALYGAEDVVSLATKHEQVVSDAPAIASSLSDEEMKQVGARTVPDALKIMPGFDMSRDVSGFYRIAVRGLRAAPEVLVLYDGHALNSPYDGRPLLDIPTDALARVETIRGPGSALYGTGAFLGVVNLVPKRVEGLEASVRGGWFQTVQGTAAAGHTWGGFGLHADASVVHSQGYQAPITRDFNSTALEQQQLKATDDAAGTTDDHHTFINVGAEARGETSAGTFALSGRVLRESRGALLGLYDTVGAGSDLGWTALLADATWHKPIGEGSISARLFFDQQNVNRFYQLTPADPDFSIGGVKTAEGLEEQTAFSTRTLGVELSGEIALHATNRLDLGLSVEQQSLGDFQYLTNFAEPGSTVTVFPGLKPPATPLLESDPNVNGRALLGVYVQDEWRPFGPLSLTLGVRADAIQLPTVTGSADAPVVTGKRFVTSFNPRLGIVVSALPNLNFKLLYGRAFRAPTIQELANTQQQNDYAGGTDTGNPNLLPATVDTLELGVEHVLATSEGKLRLRGDVFWNRLSNYILAVDTSGNDAPLQNRDPGIDVKGVELELRFEASARANAFVNATYFHAVDLAAVASQFENITDVPQYRLNLGLQLPVGPYLDFDLVAELGAERRNSDLSKLQALHHYAIPAYALVNAQLRTETLFEHLELGLAAYNLLQQSYQDDVPRPDRVPDLLPGPGFSAQLFVRVKL